MNKRLDVDPLFYDALSGDLQPPSDPLNRVHTAARLAVAGATKGEARPYGDKPWFEYTPSWAPRVETVISCTSRGSRDLTINGLVLRLADKEELCIGFFDGEGEISILAEDTMTRYPLNLGDELNQARKLVTSTSQNFFDQAI